MSGQRSTLRPDDYEKIRAPLYMSPASIGTLTAAIAALCPSHLLPTWSFLGSIKLLWSSDELSSRFYLALVGFLLGFGATKAGAWARMRAIQRLLTYRGWMTAPKSTQTMGWSVLLKLLMGPGPHSTYEFQRCLPKQPLPSLHDTLDSWLAANATLLSKEDFACTKQAVEIFRENEGPKLHRHLQERAEREVNWIFEYWMTAAYLACRDSLAINSNYFNLLNIPKRRTTNMVARAANTISLMAEYCQLLEGERPAPVRIQRLIPICMNGYKSLFNTARIPGENIDSIARHSGKKHIVVIRNGQYFVLDIVATNSKGSKKTILTPVEVKEQLDQIMQLTEDSSKACNVAALTTQNRTEWAKHRDILSRNNAETLLAVESAMFVVCLDDSPPQDEDENCKRIFTGSGIDRWFDKGFNTVVLGDASLGHNVEHTALDATVFVSLSEYHLYHEVYSAEGDVVETPGVRKRTLPMPKRLTWDVTGLEEPITKALTEYRNEVDDLDLIIMHPPYGKGFMKAKRMSPDGYIQMAIQLTYKRLHGYQPRTYEPATGRLFALGRTETVHVNSPHCVAWVAAMDDPNATTESKRGHLKKAVDQQTAYRLRATMGQGCDRHLLALFMASRELGMDIPQIFKDKSWRSPYLLSTSQTPTEMFVMGTDADFSGIIGGFGPYCKDGYGISYVLHGDEIINFSITSFKSNGSTSAKKFANTLRSAMEDMKAIFQ